MTDPDVTPTFDFARAIADSPEDVATLTLPLELGPALVLAAVHQMHTAFMNERAFRPDLRLAVIEGRDLDMPAVAVVLVAWSGDEVPGVVREVNALVFGADPDDDLDGEGM